MDIANRIKELRKSNNLTQKEFAKKIQTSDKNVWAYENNVANPPIEILDRIADLFEVSVDYLIGREDDFGIKTAVAGFDLTAEEQQIIKDYRSLSPGLKDMIKRTLDIYTNRNTTDA